MNCAKGGVFTQLCGWMGVSELWVGATSDSFYLENANDIMKRQQEFAENDLVGGKVVPFTSMLDKGYRCIKALFIHGKQTCIQPNFVKSDRVFGSNEMLCTGGVASHRSGNERGVNRSKLSGKVKKGLNPRTDPVVLNQIWEVWSFQTNFMYNTMI